jgi:hypothetical protein
MDRSLLSLFFSSLFQSPQRPYSVVFSCFNYFFQYVKELYPLLNKRLSNLHNILSFSGNGGCVENNGFEPLTSPDVKSGCSSPYG